MNQKFWLSKNLEIQGFGVGVFYWLMYIIYKFKDKKYCRIILLMEPFNMYAFIIYF